MEANGFPVKNCIITEKNIGLETLSAGTGFNVGSNGFDGDIHPFYVGRNFTIDNSSIFRESRGSINTSIT